MATLRETRDTAPGIRPDVLPPVVVTTRGIPDSEHLTAPRPSPVRPATAARGFPWLVVLCAVVMLAIGVLGRQAAGPPPSTFVVTPSTPFQTVAPLVVR